MKLAYKVVLKRNGRFRSLMDLELGAYGAEYHLGHVTLPTVEGSKLFVYTSLRKAHYTHFGSYRDRLGILLCEVGELVPIRQNLTISAAWWAHAGWTNGQLRNYEMPMTGCDDLIEINKDGGVGLADWVKPLEIVSL